MVSFLVGVLALAVAAEMMLVAAEMVLVAAEMAVVAAVESLLVVTEMVVDAAEMKPCFAVIAGTQVVPLASVVVAPSKRNLDGASIPGYSWLRMGRTSAAVAHRCPCS